MEGDAGASRLTPDELDDSSSSEVTAADSASEVTAEDSTESEDGADQTASDVTAEDSAESEGSTDDEISESDADESAVDEEEPADEQGSSRLGRAWLIGVAAALVVLAGGVGAGGYFAWKSHQESRATARHDEAAVAAAKACVAATQAPDTNAMAASAQKMIDCGAGAFRSQAILYSSLLVEAYQAANAHVQVSDLRAAVERNNPDGSIDVLVPLRVKVSNTEAQDQETGYRLRVTMVNEDGQYRIAKLDQVAR
jgi:Mce-associated membrane protein